jgi:hypothetical protein
MKVMPWGSVEVTCTPKAGGNKLAKQEIDKRVAIDYFNTPKTLDPPQRLFLRIYFPKSMHMYVFIFRK